MIIECTYATKSYIPIEGSPSINLTIEDSELLEMASNRYRMYGFFNALERKLKELIPNASLLSYKEIK